MSPIDTHDIGSEKVEIPTYQIQFTQCKCNCDGSDDKRHQNQLQFRVSGFKYVVSVFTEILQIGERKTVEEIKALIQWMMAVVSVFPAVQSQVPFS